MLPLVEVAELFRLKPGRVAAWARKGHIGSVRGPDGTTLHAVSEVRDMLNQHSDDWALATFDW